jgi:nucleoside phosphorylase
VKTLVVSAWGPEIAPLRRIVGRAAGDSEVVLRPVGIGPVEAAIGAATALAAYRPARVIFVGTAGVYPRGRQTAALGSVAIAEEMLLVSTAALRGDGYLPELQPARDAGARRLRAALRAADPAVAVARVACPLAITRSAALGRQIARGTGAALENLEAFAVARAARTAKVAFAAVLGVANRVGPEGHREWIAHHHAASRAACAVIARLLAQ